MDGWQTFALGVRCPAAAYHATRKQLLSTEQQYERLLDRLDGRQSPRGASQLPQLSHFPMRSSEMTAAQFLYGLRLPMWMLCSAQMSARTKTMTNINLYADYDMERQQVCDELSIVLWKGDGRQRTGATRSTPPRKRCFARAMDELLHQADGHEPQGFTPRSAWRRTPLR